jgi:Spy/CpxP family protein refolding chaperone
MTNTLKTSLAAGFVAVALAAGSTLVSAQDGQMRRGPGPGMRGPGPGGQMGPGGPGGPGRRGPGGPMGIGGPEFRELDLTDGQREQIKAIVDSHQAEFKAVREKLGAAHQGMRALLDAETLDESAVRAKSAEVAAADADAAILQAKVRSETLTVLTAEQQAKLKELRATRQSRMKIRREGN